MTPPKVIFISVKDNHAKVQAILRIAHHYFSQGIRLLFSVASDETARYLDELLWKSPPESFLPHAILSQPALEPIAITTSEKNVNQAPILFNLCPEANHLAQSCKVTYEYFDETHASKLEQSIKRKEIYTLQGLECVSSIN
jgi:DNA polymerase IIIc chi subunit